MPSDTDQSPIVRTVDAVTPSFVGRPNSAMHAIGLLVAGLLLLGLLPLLPLLAVYLLVDWATDRVLGDDPESPR